MFSHLQSQRVNLQLLQESYCAQLDAKLQEINGTKALIFEQSLIGLIDLVASSTFFADRNIGLIKFNADNKEELNLSRQYANIVYLIRPSTKLMDTIVSHLRQANATDRIQRHLLCLPRRSVMCEKHLEREGFRERFKSIGELPWIFFPLDSDLVSMEVSTTYHDVAVDGDPTTLYQAALGLVQLQRLYGRIPKICGKGLNCQRVWEWTKRISVEGADDPDADSAFNNGDRSPIDQLILLDRSIDVMSALVTQLTYAGLIDEFHGLPQNKFTLPSEMRVGNNKRPDNMAAGSSASPVIGVQRKTLNSRDPLYVELRDKNFNEVGRILLRRVNELKDIKGSIHQKNTVTEMKVYVENMETTRAQETSLDMHTSIAVLIRKQLDSYDFTDDLAAEHEFMVCADIDRPSAYIEDLMARKNDIRRVLRLMCIQCAAASGLKEKVLNYYKRELVQVYGLETLLMISNLERAGLLHTQTESRSYSVLRKTLQLTVDNVIEVEPRDISYVHSFYAPLTARIVEQTIKPLGWQSLKTQINQLPGPTFDDRQQHPPFVGSNIGRNGGRLTTGAISDGCLSFLNMARRVMVFFVGGCTYAEIAALRFIAQQEDNNVEFIIATTNVINKHTFLGSVLD